MPEDRIQRAVSADGTEIAGRVQGQGPPLVLVHGALGDGVSAMFHHTTGNPTPHATPGNPP